MDCRVKPGNDEVKRAVMLALGAGIHVLIVAAKTWMAGP
jgi:hypothetical protein